MAFTFFEIERRQTAIIRWILPVLFITYFIFAFIILVLTRVAFVLSGAYFMRADIIKVIEPSFRYFSSFISVVDLVSVAVLSAFAAYFHYSLTIKNGTRKLLKALWARPLNPLVPQEKQILNIIDEVVLATGGKMTIQGFISPFRFQNTYAISDSDGNHVIGVTEGLLNYLTRSQMQAVIAREAAHIISGDSLRTSLVTATFGVYEAVLIGLRDIIPGAHSARDNQELSLFVLPIPVLLPAMLLLPLAKFFNQVLAMLISRSQEYRADAVAVRLTRDPLSLAEALYIMSLYPSGPNPQRYLAPIFIVNPGHGFFNEAEGWLADLCATHPPLKRRMEVLLEMAHSKGEDIKEAFQRKPVFIDDHRFERSPLNTWKPLVKVKGKRWYLRQQGSWAGPFDLLELLISPHFTPGAYVKPEGEDISRRVFEDANLCSAIFLSLTKPSAEVQCPQCRAATRNYSYEDVQVHQCPRCAGILAGDEQLKCILHTRSVVFREPIIQSAHQILNRIADPLLSESVGYESRGLVCPRCIQTMAKMRRVYYSRELPVEVDRCVFCGLVWFDRDEIEVLQYLWEQKNPL